MDGAREGGGNYVSTCLYVCLSCLRFCRLRTPVLFWGVLSTSYIVIPGTMGAFLALFGLQVVRDEVP